ncbi:MAG: LysR substrate-binding domain-containing protein [Bacillus sp. (in: firmicutes)]
MELRHIRYFVVLAEELHFGRAAERLHIAQPPLSRQIRELEEEIGAQLFFRTKRYVELTIAGKVFKKKADQILNQVEQACISTRISSNEKEEGIVIGFTGTIQSLIPIIKKYRETNTLPIVFQQMSTADQMKALKEKRIDIGFVSAPVKSKNIMVRPLLRDRFIAALPENHPLALNKSICLNDFADETFIMTPRSAGSLYYDTFIELFLHAEFNPKITIQAHDLQTVLSFVSAGMGVAMTPSSVNPISGVVQREVEGIAHAIEVSVAWRQDNNSKLIHDFLDFLFEYYSTGNSRIDDHYYAKGE